MGNQAELNKRREIADRVKTLRSAKGISQEKMAALMDLSYTTYVKIENAQHGLSQKNLMKLRDLLSVKTDVILYGDTDSDVTFDEYIELAKFFNADNLTALQSNIQKVIDIMQKKSKVKM